MTETSPEEQARQKRAEDAAALMGFGEAKTFEYNAFVAGFRHADRTAEARLAQAEADRDEARFQVVDLEQAIRHYLSESEWATLSDDQLTDAQHELRRLAGDKQT